MSRLQGVASRQLAFCAEACDNPEWENRACGPICCSQRISSGRSTASASTATAAVAAGSTLWVRCLINGRLSRVRVQRWRYGLVGVAVLTSCSVREGSPLPGQSGAAGSNAVPSATLGSPLSTLRTVTTETPTRSASSASVRRSVKTQLRDMATAGIFDGEHRHEST